MKGNKRITRQARSRPVIRHYWPWPSAAERSTHSLYHSDSYSCFLSLHISLPMSCCSHSLPPLLIFPHLLFFVSFLCAPSVCFLSASSLLSPLTSSLHNSLSLSPCTLRSPSLPRSLLLCPSISLVARVESYYKLSWQKLKGRRKNRRSEENRDTLRVFCHCHAVIKFVLPKVPLCFIWPSVFHHQ